MENKRVRLTLYDEEGNVAKELEGNGIIFYLVQEEEDEETKKTTVESGIFGKFSPSELTLALPCIFNMVKSAKENKKEEGRAKMRAEVSDEDDER